MKDASATITYLKDYQAPAYQIESVDLCFSLFEDGAEVRNRMRLKRDAAAGDVALVLDGEELELRSVHVNGEAVSEEAYEVSDASLTLNALPAECELEVVTWIKPQENKRLEGLYRSSVMFCTQCEAEGFRRITYYLDRPDVLSIFTTRIEADVVKYPRLLSNGNLVESGALDEGRHYAVWNDPFRKPSYLFALVAGDLHCHEDFFVTMSGRKVALELFVEHKNASKCDYAIDALKRSMKWDEEVYGREYDLDIFMIVAVDDFNMGAMENKGLNIFNSSCVLAKPETTTDASYQRIEAIVAHEYFHNWSGNRVTCRDWFQLSLKEGFTVFRDSGFSADMNSRIVKRIEDVNVLRSAQFIEDAGPMSHPVRPASYMEISNFYTLTIYEKGAEVVRMLHTLLGAELFRKGSDLYFERHDGQAVTTDEFVAAMSDASGRDLNQFKRWYDQGGTPRIDVSGVYDPESKTYSLTLKQSCPATPQQEHKLPFHIPVAIGLIDSQGSDIPLREFDGATTHIVELTEESETIVFGGIDIEPIPSLLRDFSAPVKLLFPYTQDQLLFLMKHDSDGFNRWDAGQTLAIQVLQNMVAQLQGGDEAKLPRSFIEATRSILCNERLDKAMVCKLLLLPSESYLIEQSEEADVDAICKARKLARGQLAFDLRQELYRCYEANNVSSSGLGFDEMAQRALKNACLSLLSANPDQDFSALARKQFDGAVNMTEQFGALASVVYAGNAEDADDLLTRFYEQWQGDAQVLEQWFSVQSSAASLTNLDRIKVLMKHEAFDFFNPNKLRSVVGAFAAQNFEHFHSADGSGYQFLADQIIKLDDQNPQIAARLMTPLTRWRKYDAARKAFMLEELARIQNKANLSKDLREVVEKTLPN